MKIFIETLNRNCFPIYVRPEDKVADVKINIETVRGSDDYRAAQLMLIHQGKVLKDNTSLEENSVAENSYVVVMFTKSKVASNGALSSSAAPSPAPTYRERATFLTPPIVAPYAYGQDTSYLDPGYNFEASIQQILDLGRGCWNREIVIRALRATNNNKERAIEFLYSCQGIPEQQAPILPFFDRLTGRQTRNPLDIFTQGFPDMRSNDGVSPLDFLHNSPQGIHVPAPILPIFDRLSSGQARNQLDIFPQGFPDMRSNAGVGPLDFLRNCPQFRGMRAMVQANPQTLQPMLRELGMQNPDLMRLIQQHSADFLRLINEPVGGERNLTVTLEEREAIESLEAMGFDRALVLEVFFACNKNEELAANYLLDHMREFEN